MSHPCESNPELWFSEKSEDIAQAKEACGFCPVREECADLGENEEFGVWGGMTPREIRQAKRFRVLVLEELRNAQILLMQRDGASISAMARELGLPRKTLADRLRKMTGLAA
ncbi:WhiB family transcriptional regulator [Streptomyces sp. NPDC048430]|uniref:WhiB family transcriptional regulator n=1 Tax=Streptomyces sp. NPDC048430 TaxID=3155388 RepID=UPI00341BCD1C